MYEQNTAILYREAFKTKYKENLRDFSQIIF